MNEQNETHHRLAHDNAAHFRQMLVESLVANGVLHSSRLKKAFFSISREAFVQHFYERNQESKKMAWIRYDFAQMETAEYLALVYRDEPLVTRIDERLWPSSSSSSPSVMAAMLEALDVREGSRVLEIGTGTGYNTALLAKLTADQELVTTVEIDATVAASAAQALKEVVGKGVTIHVGDGFTGYPKHAPYDRIIATASVSVPPQAWIDQLASGGRLVMDLQGSLASGFLIVEKDASGKGASGYFLTRPLYFMPLVTQELNLRKAPLPETRRPVPEHSAPSIVEKGSPFPEILFDHRFRWWLQWRILGCQIRSRNQVNRTNGIKTTIIDVIEPACQTALRFRQAADEQWNVRGERDEHGALMLLNGLQRAYEDWMKLGQPEIAAYRFRQEENAPPLLVIDSFRLPLVGQ